MKKFKIGHGYDVHRLVTERDLVLGGVKIPFELGLLGHSDADALLHAVMDAILGALGEGDIGKHFPDTDEAFKGISSMLLAEKCSSIMKDKGYEIGNIDATVIAQKPKLAPYIPAMRKNIAAAFSTDEENVNVKATTEEKLGFTGNLEGIACHAVALINSIE
ncbi:MAG: 2-C-methyl-D-erythritol 2,4-cyclodiphosphate synthase [Ruminococcaceae bacterium]|nr:2-C-methyl-D-erythritol 2,4-cyclodiphosphate synthase [Oscillospiraceae bacterium]